MGDEVTVSGENPTLAVALAGRVPVKIASSSAPIKVGDFLTSSKEPGKAMKATKAGYTIGKALESWEPSTLRDTSGQAGSEQIQVFVNLSYYDPNINIYLTGLNNAKEKISNITEEAIDVTTELFNEAKDFVFDKIETIVLIAKRIITDMLIAREYIVDVSEKIDEKTGKTLDPTLGKVFLPAGQTSVQVFNNSIKKDSVVFITIKSKEATSWTYDDIVEGESFMVYFGGPLKEDIEFNYWLVNRVNSASDIVANEINEEISNEEENNEQDNPDINSEPSDISQDADYITEPELTSELTPELSNSN